MTVTVVHARSSRTLNRWLNSRHRHHPEVIAVDLPGGGKKAGIRDLGDAVIAGLGKNAELNAGYKDAELLADAWLQHTDVSAALIVEGQLWIDSQVDLLIAWFNDRGIDMFWFVSGPSTSWPAALQTPDATLGLGDMWRRFHNATSPPASMASPLPALPRCDAMVFRSRCSELLAADEFERFDAEYVAEVQMMRKEFADTSSKKRRFRMATVIKNRLAEATSTDQMVLRARAAQIAGLTEGYHVTVDTACLVGAAESLPRVGLADPECWWERLGAYRDPDCGAAAALFTYGIHPETLQTLRVGDVIAARDGELLRFVDPDGEYVIDAEPARFVNVLATYRLLTGSEESSSLFRCVRTDRSTAVGRLNKLLRQPVEEAGVFVAKAPVRKRVRRGLDWLERYGVRVERIIPESTTPATLKVKS